MSVFIHFYLIALIGYHFRELVCVLHKKKKKKAWGRSDLCLGDRCLLFVLAFVYKQLCAADFAHLKILVFFFSFKTLTNWNLMNSFKLGIFQWLADTKYRVVTTCFF